MAGLVAAVEEGMGAILSPSSALMVLGADAVEALPELARDLSLAAARGPQTSGGAAACRPGPSHAHAHEEVLAEVLKRYGGPAAAWEPQELPWVPWPRASGGRWTQSGEVEEAWGRVEFALEFPEAPEAPVRQADSEGLLGDHELLKLPIALDMGALVAACVASAAEEPLAGPVAIRDGLFAFRCSTRQQRQEQQQRRRCETSLECEAARRLGDGESGARETAPRSRHFASVLLASRWAPKKLTLVEKLQRLLTQAPAPLSPAQARRAQLVAACARIEAARGSARLLEAVLLASGDRALLAGVVPRFQTQVLVNEDAMCADAGLRAVVRWLSDANVGRMTVIERPLGAVSAILDESTALLLATAPSQAWVEGACRWIAVEGQARFERVLVLVVLPVAAPVMLALVGAAGRLSQRVATTIRVAPTALAAAKLVRELLVARCDVSHSSVASRVTGGDGGGGGGGASGAAASTGSAGVGDTVHERLLRSLPDVNALRAFRLCRPDTDTADAADAEGDAAVHQQRRAPSLRGFLASLPT